MRRLAICLAILLMMSAQPLRAETVEVAPGVKVTKKTFSSPANEQPFFGFVKKSPEMIALDENFANGITRAFGTREKAYAETTTRAWNAINAGDLAVAMKRFNQAFLLLPLESGVYHGFAAVAQLRFNDIDYADELFELAHRQPNPLNTLNADHGRLLLVAKRPRDAQKLLEKAVKDVPDFGDAWSNLSAARFQNGDSSGACAAANEAGRRKVSARAEADLAALKLLAKCNSTG